MGRCIQRLTCLLSMPLKPYDSNIRDIIKGKWEPIIQQHDREEHGSVSLSVDRIFKQSYLKSIHRLQSSLPILSKYALEVDTPFIIPYLHALTKIGLHQESLDLLKKSKFDTINRLSPMDTFLLIQTINNIDNKYDSSELRPKLIDRLSELYSTG